MSCQENLAGGGPVGQGLGAPDPSVVVPAAGGRLAAVSVPQVPNRNGSMTRQRPWRRHLVDSAGPQAGSQVREELVGAWLEAVGG